MTVHATIDMPECRGMNIFGIDEFDSVISDRIVNVIEDCDDIVEV